MLSLPGPSRLGHLVAVPGDERVLVTSGAGGVGIGRFAVVGVLKRFPRPAAVWVCKGGVRDDGHELVRPS